MSSSETLELGKKVLKILTEKNFNSEKHEMYLIC